VEGQLTDVFKRNAKAEFEGLSFSLLYSLKGQQRTLDVVCKDKKEVGCGVATGPDGALVSVAPCWACR
jgi:hypothetical protein